MGVLIEEINQLNTYLEKRNIVNMKNLMNFKYEKIYNDYKSRFYSEFCILLIDQKLCYGHINTNNKKLHTKLSNDIKLMEDNMNLLIYFEYKDLYRNIPLLLQNNISVILIDTDYNVTAIHHPENKYHANSFSFVYFPF
jgi:hypothetical protein